MITDHSVRHHPFYYHHHLSLSIDDATRKMRESISFDECSTIIQPVVVETKFKLGVLIVDREEAEE